MSKFTPGPWVWTGIGDIRASGMPLQLQGRSHRAIANRALIAAAPELLAALKAIVSDGCLIAADVANSKMVNAAIAKATGETP